VNYVIVCAKIPIFMCQIDPTFADAAQTNPHETFRVILRVQGDLDIRHEQLEAEGFTITRRSRLIHGFSAAATGAAILRVLPEEWLVSIEQDGTVHTMETKS
jgi:hypothetical protein